MRDNVAGDYTLPTKYQVLGTPLTLVVATKKMAT